jgi:hypothetical protein
MPIVAQQCATKNNLCLLFTVSTDNWRHKDLLVQRRWSLRPANVPSHSFGGVAGACHLTVSVAVILRLFICCLFDCEYLANFRLVGLD